MSRNRLRQIIFRFRKPLVMLSALCLALLAGEVAVRCLVDVPRIHAIELSEATSPYRRSSNPILRYELKPGFRAAHRNGVVQTNEHGNRDRPRSYGRPDGVQRIILLGDSVVESVNLLGDHETINIRLEELFSDGATEVLNLAVAGYCTRAEVELLREKGLKYQPDTVVVVFVENDFQNFNPDHSFDNQDVTRPIGVNTLFRHSHFFRAVCLQTNWFGFNSQGQPEALNDQILGDNNVADGFRLLRELADEHDFDVVVGIWPEFTDTSVVDRYTMPDDPQHLVVEHIAWSHRIPTFRFSTDFRADWNQRTTTPNDATPRQFYTVDADSMHPTPTAARIAAETLHAILTGSQSTKLQQPSPAASEIASRLGELREPPDPLLKRQPAYAVLLKQNRAREAQEYAQRLLDEDPGDADAWCLKAGSHGARGNLALATECYDRALSIDPKHVEALVWRGVIAFASGRNEPAADYFQRALDQDPDHARANFHLGLALADSSPEQAAIHFRRATELFPSYVDAHHELARVLLVLEQPQKAEEACLRAIAIEHENADAHYDLGVSYADQSQFEKASRSFEEAIRLRPEFVAAHIAASDAGERQGDDATAIRHLRRAMEFQPDRIDAAAKLAWILATSADDELRDGDESLRLALHCLARVETYQTLDVLAAAHAEVGDFESAIRRQQQAIGAAPAESKAELESRMRTYEAHKPHRRVR